MLLALLRAVARPPARRPVARRAARALTAMAAPAHSPAHSPSDVNCFWFGPLWATNRAALNTPEYFSDEVSKRWFGGGPAMDAECRAFAETIHAAGRGELAAAPGWGRSPEALMATVVLLDQMTRGAFRCVESWWRCRSSPRRRVGPTTTTLCAYRRCAAAGD